MLSNYKQYYRESLMLINGTPGSGKTYSALHIAAMKLYAMDQSKKCVVLLVPNREALLILVKMIDCIYNEDVLKSQMLICSEMFTSGDKQVFPMLKNKFLLPVYEEMLNLNIQ